MKTKKTLIITLCIISVFFLMTTLFLAFQNFNYSFDNYVLKFQLDVARNEKSKLEKSIPVYDRYDAYKQLTSLPCFKDYNQGFTVIEDEDPKFWFIKLQGYIPNPQTGETDKSNISTLGVYLVQKDTGEVLNYPNKTKEICN